MSRRPNRARAFAPDPGADGRQCESPNCPALGEYRAPLSRQVLNQYRWFCLEHVRAYNASWDFYKGMSPGQIEQHLRADTYGQRPTWPLGRIGGRIDPVKLDPEMLRDPLQILSAARNAERVCKRNEAPKELREPLSVLGLSWPTTLNILKSRYKELAKRHHPDANQGDRAAEDRIKTINLAYATLRSRLAAEPKLAATG